MHAAVIDYISIGLRLAYPRKSVQVKCRTLDRNEKGDLVWEGEFSRQSRSSTWSSMYHRDAQYTKRLFIQLSV